MVGMQYGTLEEEGTTQREGKCNCASAMERGHSRGSSLTPQFYHLL